MSYTKTDWIDNITQLDASNINNMENGIANNDTAILNIGNVINLELVHNSDWTSGSNANGNWEKSPTGKITQWGQTVINTGSTLLNFPISFTTITTPAPAIMITIRSATPTAITVCDSNLGLGAVQLRSTYSGGVAIDWMAIGY